MATLQAFSIIEILVPIAYLLFSLWTAYTSGYNLALMKKHRPRGAGKYSPYLTVLASFGGVAIVAFLGIDAWAYESGFLNVDLPRALSNLDFFEFLVRQFTTLLIPRSTHYLAFVTIGVAIALCVSYFAVRFAFNYGKSRIENE